MELSRRQIDFLHYPSLSEEFPMISQSLEPLPSLPATFYILNIPYRLKCSVLEKVYPILLQLYEFLLGEPWYFRQDLQKQ